MPNRFTEDRLLQAIGAVVNLAAYSIKKISTGDDLKVRTLTIVLETASSGWVQDVLQFDREHSELNDIGPGEDEPEAGLEVTTDGDGHVETVRSENGKVGAAIGEPRVGIEFAVGDVVELRVDPTAFPGEEAQQVRRRRTRRVPVKADLEPPSGEPTSQHVCRSCGERKDSWAEMVDIGWLCTDCAVAAPTPVTEVAGAVDQRAGR